MIFLLPPGIKGINAKVKHPAAGFKMWYRSAPKAGSGYFYKFDIYAGRKEATELLLM